MPKKEKSISKKSCQGGQLFLGLDLSICRTGFVLVDEGGKLVYQGLIESKPSEEKTPTTELRRLTDLRNRICERIPSQTMIVAIEGLAFAAKNTTSLVQLGALNYFIREYLDTHISYFIVAPTALKKFITGKGNADKEMVMKEIYKRYKVRFDDDNLADAFALAQVAKAMYCTAGLSEEQKEIVNNLLRQIM